MLQKIRNIIRDANSNINNINIVPIKFSNYDFNTFRNKRKITLIIKLEQLQGDVLFRITIGLFTRNIRFDAFIGWEKPGKHIKEFDYRFLV